MPFLLRTDTHARFAHPRGDLLFLQHELAEQHRLVRTSTNRPIRLVIRRWLQAAERAPPIYGSLTSLYRDPDSDRQAANPPAGFATKLRPRPGGESPATVG